VVDLTGMADAEITSGPEYIYTPRCARVRVGQTVTFRTDPSTSWNVHPLIAGRIVDDLEVEDPTSPIPLTETGTAPVRVTFREAGSYGYYCTRHWLSGHVGALHVVP
jgi:plastocyanin